METIEKKILLNGVDVPVLFGSNDSNLVIVENKFDAGIVARGDVIIVRGEPNEVALIERIFRELIAIVNKSSALTIHDVETVIDALSTGKEPHIPVNDLASVILYTKTGVINARTQGQREYYKLAKANDIVFAIGPAGTGKTYLAVAMAVAALRNREITKVVLCRPAVEAGESLGFLPGDLREKVDPYLRPLYDALEEMLSAEKLKSFIEKNIIEIAPLAYMRGRTLNNAFVILDEAQNATAAQMKMFLTRLGMNSRAIVTGDVTQIDLPHSTTSGLVQVEKILRGIEGIAFASFSKQDVVRHRLVKDIIDAYGKYDAVRHDPLGSPAGSCKHCHRRRIISACHDAMELFHIGFFPVTVWDIADVLLVTFVFYRLYVVMRGTIAAQIFVGLLIILCGSFLAQAANLRVLSWLLHTLTDVWVIVLVVLFQPELRRLLLLLGRNPLVKAFITIDISESLDEIAEAARELAARRHGALIILERTTALNLFAEMGISLQALVSKELLLSIFNPTSPLHDGAVIIKDRIVESARAIVPLSTATHGEKRLLGTRHRAGLGISEQADVVSVIISEENGRISVAMNGNLELLEAENSHELLRKRLYDAFGVQTKPRRVFGRMRPVSAFRDAG